MRISLRTGGSANEEGVAAVKCLQPTNDRSHDHESIVNSALYHQVGWISEVLMRTLYYFMHPISRVVSYHYD